MHVWQAGSSTVTVVVISQIVGSLLTNPLEAHDPGTPRPDQSNNFTSDAPVLLSGPVVECKHRECWKGKTFLIIQTDTKTKQNRHEWRRKRFDFTNLDLQTVSYWYTRTYAKRHNMRYMLVSVPDAPPGRWYYFKPYVAARFVGKADFVLLMDFDVMVANYEQDIRCLLEQWGFGCDDATPLIVQAQEPHYNTLNWTYRFPNGTAQLNVNMGWVVMRNTPRTVEILQRYTDMCNANWTRWNGILYEDQGIWNVDVRPTFKPGELQIVPCEDGNGYRWISGHSVKWGCGGRQITHGWMWGKDLLRNEMFRRLLVQWSKALEHDTAHITVPPGQLWADAMATDDE